MRRVLARMQEVGEEKGTRGLCIRRHAHLSTQIPTLAHLVPLQARQGQPRAVLQEEDDVAPEAKGARRRSDLLDFGVLDLGVGRCR